MPPPDPLIHSAWQKAEHTLGQLLVLFGASVLIVFIIQIPQTQAQFGSGNKMCDGAASQYKCPWPKKAKECEKMKKGKKDGRKYKPCQESCGTSGGIAKGKCIAPQKCLTTTTCQGKAPKKANPKEQQKGDDKKKEEGGKPPEMPKPPEPPKKEPKEKKENQNQTPCPADPNLKQGTPECDAATKAKGSTGNSIWKKLMDLAS